MSQEFIDILIKIAADWSMIPIVLIGAYAMVFKIPKDKRLQAYSRALMAGLTAYLLAKLIGFIYQPSDMRPFELINESAKASFLNNPGFPSDHVLFASAITCAVWFETKIKSLSIILAILVIVVGVGRVMALVHSPADVVGGIVIALIGSLWYINCKN